VDIRYDIELLKQLAESCDNPKEEKKYKKDAIELLQQELEDLELSLSDSESPEEAAEITSYIQLVRAEIKRLSKHERWKPGRPRKDVKRVRLGKLLAARKNLKEIAYKLLKARGLTPKEIAFELPKKVNTLQRLMKRPAKK
jgi:hypothetical protein